MGRRSQLRLPPETCQCSPQLDPFPRTNVLRGAAVLPPLCHYCCVCNIQLNSCRQALIHCAGKKHLKRLQFLQYCLRTIDFESFLCKYPSLRLNCMQMSFFPPTTYSSPPTTGYGSAGTTSTISAGSDVTTPSVASVVSSVDGKSTDTSSLVSSASYQSDPVTKAVMDNIMGKLPTTKSTVTAKCDVCNLEFSGETVLQTHLAGAKHAKRIKSMEILKDLQGSGQTFTRDVKTNILRCDVCDVVVNSSQQLQTHLAGNKHKTRVAKKNSLSTGSADSSGAANGEGTKGGTQNGEKLTEVPPGVQKLMEGAGNRSGKYYCEACSVSLNSEIQLQQHLGSRKHKEKATGTPRPKFRPYPARKRPNPSFSESNSIMTAQYTQPLSNNFVFGGAMK